MKAESGKVTSGSVALADGSLTTGSAELTVKDVTVSQDKKKEFENEAEGYTVSDYLGIDLYQVTFKGNTKKADDGTWTADDVWSKEIDELENKTTYNKVVKLIKKSGAKNVKYKYKKKK